MLATEIVELVAPRQQLCPTGDDITMNRATGLSKPFTPSNYVNVMVTKSLEFSGFLKTFCVCRKKCKKASSELGKMVGKGV